MDEFKAFGSECGITTFLQRVSYLNHVIFPDVRSSSFVLFIMLLPVLYFEQYMIYSVGLIPSQFYNVIGSKDIKGFYGILIYTISFVFTIALVKGIRWFLQHLLKITWSKFLYEFLHRMYFLHGNYFKVSISGFRGHDASSIITHNVDKFCTFYSELLPDICSLPFLAILYTYILFMNLGWTGVLAIYGFITISKAVTVCLMTPMLRYAPVYEQKLTKFRLHHDHIRANSESLAFCDCTEVEFERASEKLNELISAEKQLGRCKLGWYIVINAFDYLGSALSYIVLFMPVYKSLYNNDDAVQISVLISKNSFFVIYLISLLTSLMTLWERIATLTKIVHEIYELAELLENLTKDADAEPSLALSRIQKLEFQGWSLKNVTIRVPSTNHIVMKDLTMKIIAGKNMLILGKIRAGKSSLLKTLRGLWNIDDGEIITNLPDSPSGVVYLPQKPSLINGCLREQIIYPSRKLAEFAEDQTLVELLHFLDLEILLFQLGGLEAEISWNWLETLSASEMQRLNFLRVFYHQPLFIMADDATSAMSPRHEEAVLQKCKDLNITMIAATQTGSTITQFFETILTLDGTGGWLIQDVKN